MEISIHALLAESDINKLYDHLRDKISIHALLAESDSSPGAPRLSAMYFYPRSPCGERHMQRKHTSVHRGFLSTLSLRRATRSNQAVPAQH